MVRVTGTRRLGVSRGRVEVADGDPGWPSAFRQLAAELRTALAGLGAAVEHVGSTAVPGLAAKPIIDIGVGVHGDIAISRLTAALCPLGYIYRGDGGGRGGHLFVLEDRPGHRIAHVHVVSTGGSQWSQWLAFRDRLREDPVARAGYERLKRQLAERFPDDRRAYTAAKDPYIARLLTEPPAGRSHLPSGGGS